MANSVIDKATALYAKASTEWGNFRLGLAAHPLTFFWGALASGGLIGYGIRLLTKG